jgi:hypothetical protein
MSSELRIFVPLAIGAIMNRLVPRMEAVASTSIVQLCDLNPAIPERIMAGELYHIGLTNPPYVNALVAAGYVHGPSHYAFGRVPLAVCRKAGEQDPVRKDIEEIKDLFRRAESIAYTGAGTSGKTYLDVMKRLDLNNVILSKSQALGGGEPVAAVMAREIELAVAPLTTILSTSGVAPVAIFPDGLESHIDMSVFVSTRPHTGAEAILAFLTSRELDDELAAAGVLRFELN